MTGMHGRLRLLVATSQALSLGALAAAVTPFFRGGPAPLGLTVVLMAASVALGLTLGLWPRGGRDPGGEARLRAAVAGGAWALATTLLLVFSTVPEAQALVWAIVGFTASLAAFAASRLESEDGARALASRSALAALAAGVVGAFMGHGVLPGPAALALVALLVAGVVHALARAHYRAVDPDRVGRHAAALVAVIAVLAVLLAVGPVHDAVLRVLAFVWNIVAYALTLVAVGVGYVMYLAIMLLRLLIHPHPRKLSQPPSRPGRTHVRPPAIVHASPLLLHAGPLLLLLAAGAIAVWLVGRVRHSRGEAASGLFRDEILPPGALGRRGRARPGRHAPAEGLARAYAQALSVLALAQDGRAHPRPADTPDQLDARVAQALGADGEAPTLFHRLSQAYADWHYGSGANRVPDAPAQVLRLLRQALPPGRIARRRPPA